MSKKKYKWIIYEKKGGVAKIILNNPEKYNALTEVMILEMRDALLDAQGDDAAKVIVITGAGERSFCAGQDLSTIKGVSSHMDMYRYLRDSAYETHRLIERIEKPVIARVNGHCIAGGLEFALACDFIIASENATFAITEVSLGIIPGSGGIVRFIRAIPARKAREMLYTGARISAKEAEALGLVNRVVPLTELDKAVEEVTGKIVDKSPSALRLAKMTITYALETPDIDSALALERTASALILSTEDSREGAAAFLEKRRPQFKGR